MVTVAMTVQMPMLINMAMMPTVAVIMIHPHHRDVLIMVMVVWSYLVR